MTGSRPVCGSGRQGNGDREHEQCVDSESVSIHDQFMDVAYISALSALAGSVVGGLTSGITTWLSLRAQARAGQHAHDKSLREDLYRDFIVAASQAYGNAVVSNEPQIQELVAIYAMISRMRILSSPTIVACADKIMRATIDTLCTECNLDASIKRLCSV